MSAERLTQITARLRADSEKGTIPGAVLLVARHGKLAPFEEGKFTLDQPVSRYLPQLGGLKVGVDRRVQLGRRGRNLLLGGPEGRSLRRVHDAVAQATDLDYNAS